MFKKCKPKCGLMILLALAGIAGISFVVMSLWNWLMPALFTGIHTIDYWHAIGLLVLSKILFGGFGRRCCKRSHCHAGQCESMSPEEEESVRCRLWKCSSKSE